MEQRLKVLCITEDPDRPTTAMFVGLKNAGVEVTVICPPGERRTWLEQNGVRVLDVPLAGFARSSSKAATPCCTSSATRRCRTGSRRAAACP
jgi:hypothetical protein